MASRGGPLSDTAGKAEGRGGEKGGGQRRERGLKAGPGVEADGDWTKAGQTAGQGRADRSGAASIGFLVCETASRKLPRAPPSLYWPKPATRASRVLPPSWPSSAEGSRETPGGARPLHRVAGRNSCACLAGGVVGESS